MKLGKIDPWGHTRGCPVTHLDFWPPGAGVYLVSETLKMPLGEFEGLIGNFSSGRLSLVSLQLQQASAYYLVYNGSYLNLGLFQ